MTGPKKPCSNGRIEHWGHHAYPMPIPTSSRPEELHSHLFRLYSLLSHSFCIEFGRSNESEHDNNKSGRSIYNTIEYFEKKTKLELTDSSLRRLSMGGRSATVGARLLDEAASARLTPPMPIVDWVELI